KDDHFTRVIRADPKRKGLLYAGTERGMVVSFDDGSSWQSLQLNLPIVPITDLAIKDDDLVVATQGRSFWVLDDLTPLRQVRPELVGDAGGLRRAVPLPDRRPRQADGDAPRHQADPRRARPAHRARQAPEAAQGLGGCAVRVGGAGEEADGDRGGAAPDQGPQP